MNNTKQKSRRMHDRIFALVEARGVEPLSENRSSQLSPGAGNLFSFPPQIAGCQAKSFSSFSVMTGRETKPGSRSPLIDALIRTAVLSVRRLPN